MRLSEFDYELPRELIAQRPLGQRDSSRMLLLDRAGHAFRDAAFSDLPQILRPGDLLVVNNTSVFPARLLGRRRGVKAQPIGAHNPAAREFLSAEVELFLTRHEGGDVWWGLVHPGRKIRTGEVLVFGEGDLEAEVLGRGEFGLRRVHLTARQGSVASAIDRLGHVPLPPYISRPDDPADRDTYQTVYAKVRGAVAAPTAGFHFTRRILDALDARGVEVCEITLHVGPGTFRPVQVEKVEDHLMDAEHFEISEAAAQAIARTREEGRRVIAVGTTSVRTLEAVALQNGGKIVAARGETDLFITPGFEFQVIHGLLTNFHLPKSTLLMLVAAFAGRDLTFAAYRHAIAERYRFYSYGDCMLIL
jgi:S-adenosylmethionine:tRNA ribosyltransferase-isomerase